MYMHVLTYALDIIFMIFLEMCFSSHKNDEYSIAAQYLLALVEFFTRKVQ